MPKPVRRASLLRPVDQDMSRLQVLMDEASAVHSADGGGNGDCEAQEAPRFQRRADQPIERLACRILEHQCDATTLAPQLEWARRPRAFQLVLQPKFVCKTIEARRRRVFPSQPNG